MDTAISDFLDHIKLEKGGAENTVSAYAVDLRQFKRVLFRHAGGAIRPEDITRAHLGAYLDWLKNRDYRPSTIARKIAAVRSFLTHVAREQQLNVRDWLAHLPSPPPEKRNPRILSKAEVDALLAAPASEGSPRSLRDSALLSILFVTGLRVAEVASLELGNLDMLRGRVSVPNAEDKWLPMGVASDPIRRYVRQARPHFARDPLERTLFLNQQGRGLSRQGIWLVVKRWAKRAGLGTDVTPQTLRHSLAHHLLRQGRSRREVQSTLGLTSSNAIRAYLSRIENQEGD